MADTIFADGLERFEDRLALTGGVGDDVSYAALAARADAFAARLGATPQLLVLECRNEADAIVAYLGALRGRHPVILTAPDKPDDLARLKRTYRPAATYRRDGDGWTLDRDADAEAPATHPELAVMLSTSGTTGATKLVRLSHGNVDANARSIAEYLGLRGDDRAITSLPIHYSYGLSVVNSHLASGAALVLTDLSVIDEAFWTLFEDAGATSLAGVPYTYDLLDRVGFQDRALPALRTLTQAGGRLPPETAARYAAWTAARGVRLFVMYGQTEATARMAYVPPERLAEKPGSIGIAIPGGAFSLRDEQGAMIAAADVTGELVYSGPNVMMGYAEAAGDLASGAAVEALVTGDLAQRDADGFYRIVGRKKRFSKLFGLRIALDEVEAKLRGAGHVGVASGDDELIAVALTGDADAAAVQAMLAKAYALPRDSFAVTVAPDLPTLPSGKIDYRRILADAHAVRAARPAGAGTHDVLQLFKTALPTRTITPDDSFMALGGDSLAFISLLTKLDELVPHLPDGWEELSIAELQALADVEDAGRVGLFGYRPVATEMALRAGAIFGVVLHHSLGSEVGGGLDILLLLMGYSMMRFQRERLLSPGRWKIASEALYKVIMPYWVILTIYAIVCAAGADISVDLDPPTASDFLLVSNVSGRPPWTLFAYWFFPAYAQIILVILLCVSLPPVRRALAETPVRALLATLALAAGVKVLGAYLFHHAELRGHTPDQYLYLPVFGALLFFATTWPRRLALFALALAIGSFSYLPGFDLWRSGFPGSLRGVALVFGAGLLLFTRHLPMLAIGRRIVMAIASASFVIYLSHPILKLGVWELRLQGFLYRSFRIDVAVAVVLLALGVLISRVWDRIVVRLNARLHLLSPALVRLLGREP